MRENTICIFGSQAPFTTDYYYYYYYYYCSRSFKQIQTARCTLKACASTPTCPTTASSHFLQLGYWTEAPISIMGDIDNAMLTTAGLGGALPAVDVSRGAQETTCCSWQGAWGKQTCTICAPWCEMTWIFDGLQFTASSRSCSLYHNTGCLVLCCC